jgi:hypothetical protein
LTLHFAEDERKRFFEELWRHWDRDVHLFRQPFSSPLATETDFWHVLEGWSREVRAGQCFVQPRWVEKELLPSGKDSGLAAFCQRVEREDSRDWLLYQADGVQRWNPVVWHRLTELVRPILAHAGGLPPGGMMLDLFLGRYDRTPTGIHRDEADVLAFVTLGPKRLYFWPREAFEPRFATPEGNHFQTGIWSYERHLDSAIVVEADAGDVIYWPRGYYHVGASPDHWSGMLTLTMWWQASAQSAVRSIVSAILSGDGPPASYVLEPDALAAAAHAVPTALVDASEAARAALGSRWSDALAEAWARVATAYGFVTPPARQKTAATAASRYLVRHPVAVVEIAGQPRIFSCGHSLALPSGADTGLADRLEALPVGQTFEVEKQLGVPANAAAARNSMLTSLQAVGAIVPA